MHDERDWFYAALQFKLNIFGLIVLCVRECTLNHLLKQMLIGNGQSKQQRKKTKLLTTHSTQFLIDPNDHIDDDKKKQNPPMGIFFYIFVHLHDGN